LKNDATLFEASKPVPLPNLQQLSLNWAVASDLAEAGLLHFISTSPKLTLLRLESGPRRMSMRVFDAISRHIARQLIDFQVAVFKLPYEDWNTILDTIEEMNELAVLFIHEEGDRQSPFAKICDTDRVIQVVQSKSHTLRDLSMEVGRYQPVQLRNMLQPLVHLTALQLAIDPTAVRLNMVLSAIALPQLKKLRILLYIGSIAVFSTGGERETTFFSWNRLKKPESMTGLVKTFVEKRSPSLQHLSIDGRWAFDFMGGALRVSKGDESGSVTGVTHFYVRSLS
jgi:hypothetical protein